ncbi:MAG: chemotaxis protein CheX [Rhodospirillaceae bacterium]
MIPTDLEHSAAKVTETRMVMDVISDHAERFLQQELDLSVKDRFSRSENVKLLKLKALTSLVAVGGDVNLLIGFSFDDSLLQEIFQRFTADIEVSEDERELYLHETASEIINTIIGNSTKDINSSKTPISLSPPIILIGAKSIYRDKDAVFFTVELVCDQGSLEIDLIGPKWLFDAQLNYVGNEGGAKA